MTLQDIFNQRYRNVTYLSDGAYVANDRLTESLVLFTTDGISITNEVFLDHDAILELNKFLEGSK